MTRRNEFSKATMREAKTVACYMCEREFEDREQANLIPAPHGGNFIVCDSCMEREFNEHFNIGTRQ